MVDASDTAIGAVVQQLVDDVWQPLGFFSLRLNDAQKKYSAYDRELLAAYSGIKHFRFYLEGRKFTLYTDHKPLIFAFFQNPEKASPRQFRHLDYISQFTTDIRHISGLNNVVADTLSRLDAIHLPASIDYSAIADAQDQDPELMELILGNSSLILESFPLSFGSEKSIYCDTSQGIKRPFIPKVLRKQVFESFHNSSHPGIQGSIRLISKHVVWPSMRKDIKKLAQCCLSCQQAKISKHTFSPTGTFKLSSKRFQEIHLDIIGPLPVVGNFKYCVTLIDRFTRWAEAIPVSDISAATVAFAVFDNWISRFGVPEIIVTDQGGQFESSLFRELGELVGFKRHRTSPYHPQSNGFIERWHRTLKTALMSHNRSDWRTLLPTVLLGLRTSFSEEFQCTPSELTYGSSIRIPAQFLDVSVDTSITQSELVLALKKHFAEIKPVSASSHSKSKIFVHPKLMDCTHVFMRTDSLRKSLQPPYSGPYEVIHRYSKNFSIRINGTTQNVSIDRLKPCFSLVEDTFPFSSSSVSPNLKPESTSNTATTLSGSGRTMQRTTLPNSSHKSLNLLPSKSAGELQPPSLSNSSGETQNSLLAHPCGKPKKKVTFELPKTSSFGRIIKTPKKFE